MIGQLGGSERDGWRPLPLHTQRVVLEPIGRSHYEFLRRAEVISLGPTWRHRGAVRSPEAFSASLWAGVLCQYLALGAPSGEPVGWFQCYNADQTAGAAFFAAGRFAEAKGLDLTFQEAAWLFVEHLLDCWPLQKLVMEVPEFNLGRIESAIGDLFQIEGRLTNMTWAGGRHWDLVLLTLDRQAWNRSNLVAYMRSRVLRRATETDKAVSSGAKEETGPIAVEHLVTTY